MTKLEKVIKAIEIDIDAVKCPKECPYEGEVECGVLKDALELLKEQEPIKPIRNLGITRCGNCNREIDKYDGIKYCPECGRVVKWE